MSAKEVICPYCNEPAILTDSSEVYGKSFGPIWLCRMCEAYVGVHKNNMSFEPLGTLATSELRDWRKKAHAVFDPIWKKKVAAGMAKGKARGLTYAQMSRDLNLPTDKCHIAMFDIKTCKKLIDKYKK